MARLNHPNVVDVYDAGQCRWGVYIVMECVCGGSLRTWSQPRSWREVVRAFIGAGRGLAAAHAVGLVHRDFKPANVLVGDDGRTRVTDFGLVLAAPASVETPGESRASAPPDAPGSGFRDRLVRTSEGAGSRLTASGRAVGTPAYLSPEQHRGLPATARSDQFAFFVALAEALYGRRPTLGSSLLELAESSQHAADNLEASRPEIPLRLADIVRRGLCRDPHGRFASMREVVAALEATISSRPRKIQLVAALAGVGVAAAIAAVARPDATASQCSDVTAEVDRVWSWATRTRIEDHLRTPSSAAARRAAQAVPARLDEYAQQWIDARTELCRETARTLDLELEDSGDHELELDASTTCLERRLADLGAAVTIVLDPQTTTAQARSIAAGLPSPRACLGPSVGDTPKPLPVAPGTLAEQRRLFARIAEVSALLRVYRFEDALGVLDAEWSAIERLGNPTVGNQARLQRGILFGLLGKHERGLAALESLYADAVEAGHSKIASSAAITIANELGVDPRNADSAERWARAGLSHAERTDSVEHRLEALRVHADLQLFRGQLALAVQYAEHGLEFAEQHPDEPYPEIVAALRHTVGNVALVEGRAVAANDAFETELALLEARYGSMHPRLSDPLMGLIQAAVMLGQDRRAERLLARREATLTSAADVLASQKTFALAMRSMIAELRGDFGSAVEYAQAAVELTSEAKGAEHPDMVVTLSQHGRSALSAGDAHAALASFVAAADLCRQLSGETHACGGQRRQLVGQARSALGDNEGALEDYIASLAELERRHGPGSPMVVAPLTMTAEALLSVGRSVEALLLLRRAQAIVASQSSNPEARAHVEFALAQTLIEADPSPTASAEARVLAVRSLHAYRALPPLQAQADEVARWMATRLATG